MLNKLYTHLKRNTAWVITHVAALYFAFLLFESPKNYYWVLRYSGYSAIGFLAITLSLSPLKLIFKRSTRVLKLNRYRRQLGVAVFSYTCVHALSYLLRFHSFEKIWKVLWIKPYLPVAWIALPILLVLALTSNHTSIKHLSFSTWKRLHQNVYWAEFAIFLHLALLKRISIIYWVMLPLVLLQSVRLVYTYRTFKQKQTIDTPPNTHV